MRINHNISSMVAGSALNTVNRGLGKSLEKLSTGLRINRASDDAAGLSVSEQLRTQVNGIKMASRNAEDGISLLQIAEGAANEISSILQRMRELTVQSANDTLTSTERGYLDTEYSAMISEIDRIADGTQYNGSELINGAGWGGGACVLHIGPNSDPTTNEITVTIDDISAGTLTVATGVDTQANALTAMGQVDAGIDLVNTMRSEVGATVNRLEHAIDNLSNQLHNTQAAESNIRDVDFASESSEFTKNQILMQSATSMLAQSNMIPSNVLGLLG